MEWVGNRRVALAAWRRVIGIAVIEEVMLNVKMKVAAGRIRRGAVVVGCETMTLDR